MQADAVIIGGAYAGASAALLLKRRNPAWRIVIVEKAAEFDRKVGESTTEVSSRFMVDVLGITRHLGHEQLNKQGLRMWFHNSAEDDFEQCVEVGSRNNSRLSGFQVDRAVLDEYLLSLAVEAGCELFRPAKVKSVDLNGEGRNQLIVQMADGGEQTIEARWVVDASGRAALLARKLGLLTPMKEHPVNAIWARFKGVRDWDGHAARKRFPAYAKACNTGRQWSTNHLMGYGWWCWIIPLKGGDTSIGLVYDTRLFTPPEGATLADRLQAHLMATPVGREMLCEAQPLEGDVRAYSQLPYSVSKVAGDGWILAGDAAGFLDPLYSPGLDFCSYTAHQAHTVVGLALEGKPMDLMEVNARFSFCFRSWFEGVYRDKYYYLGDAELMSAAFLMDIGSYHLGPVREVFSCSSNYSVLPFGGRIGRAVAAVMAFSNRRLVVLAQRKREVGFYGEANTGWRLLIGGFLPNYTSGWLLMVGMMRWLRAEWRDLWVVERKLRAHTQSSFNPKRVLAEGDLAASSGRE